MNHARQPSTPRLGSSLWSGSDVMIQHYPLDMQTVLHHADGWTVQELAEAIPPLLAFRT